MIVANLAFADRATITPILSWVTTTEPPAWPIASGIHHIRQLQPVGVD
jgi:hypothetical protein